MNSKEYPDCKTIGGVTGLLVPLIATVLMFLFMGDVNYAVNALGCLPVAGPLGYIFGYGFGGRIVSKRVFLGILLGGASGVLVIVVIGVLLTIFHPEPETAVSACFWLFITVPLGEIIGGAVGRHTGDEHHEEQDNAVKLDEFQDNAEKVIEYPDWKWIGGATGFALPFVATLQMVLFMEDTVGQIGAVICFPITGPLGFILGFAFGGSIKSKREFHGILIGSAAGALISLIHGVLLTLFHPEPEIAVDACLLLFLLVPVGQIIGGAIGRRLEAKKQ